MSKIFSFVELETNAGITDEIIVAGIPDWEDIEKMEIYNNLLKSNENTEFIKVVLNSYCFGHDKGVGLTNTEDLEYITSLENFKESAEVDWLSSFKFKIYPHQI